MSQYRDLNSGPFPYQDKDLEEWPNINGKNRTLSYFFKGKCQLLTKKFNLCSIIF